MQFKGIYTALVTPFKKDETVDEEALRSLVEFQITQGVAGLVPVGTTGESPTLGMEEHLRVIEIVINQSAGRVPVIAGTGSNCTDEAIGMTRQAKKLGAAASLQVAPYYNKPAQEGFYQHFMRIADLVDLPMILYNIPGRCGKSVDNAIIMKLAQHPNIVGIKDATGSIETTMSLIAAKPQGFSVLSGDDNLLLPMAATGAVGVISVASNIIPAWMVQFGDAAVEGRMEEARSWQYKLMPLFKALFIESNPIPVKYALSLLGKIEEMYRLPLCPMADTEKEKVREVMIALGILPAV
jgi:4-hydroxy-tetrahydrodipicolinate synthase